MSIQERKSDRTMGASGMSCVFVSKKRTTAEASSPAASMARVNSHSSSIDSRNYGIRSAGPLRMYHVGRRDDSAKQQDEATQRRLGDGIRCWNIDLMSGEWACVLTTDAESSMKVLKVSPT